MSAGYTDASTAPWTSAHINAWLVSTGEGLSTRDGRRVQVFQFRHKPAETILSAWAKPFRNRYSADCMLGSLRSRTGPTLR